MAFGKLYRNPVEMAAEGGVIVLTPQGGSPAGRIAAFINRNIRKWADRNSLWDMRTYDFSQLDYRDVSHFLSQVQQSASVRSNRRTAFLVDGSLGFGITRMFMTLAEGRDLDIHLAVFEDKDEALQWLRESPDHPPG